MICHVAFITRPFALNLIKRKLPNLARARLSQETIIPHFRCERSQIMDGNTIISTAVIQCSTEARPGYHGTFTADKQCGNEDGCAICQHCHYNISTVRSMPMIPIVRLPTAGSAVSHRSSSWVSWNVHCE
jgi:hypothetical protein